MQNNIWIIVAADGKPALCGNYGKKYRIFHSEAQARGNLKKIPNLPKGAKIVEYQPIPNLNLCSCQGGDAFCCEKCNSAGGT